MKHIYSLTYQFIARFLIISMFLQSCGGFSNLPNPIQEQTIEENQELTKQLTIKHIVDKEFIAEGDHLVAFREEADQLVADVEVNVPAGFSKSYEGVAVNMDEKDTNLIQLPHMSQEAQKYFIHFNPPKNDQPGYIYVGNTGLKGGGNGVSSDKGNKKAAKKGNAAAQYNLGVMYYNGRGVVQSDQEAFKWFKKAADQGDADAQFCLGVMYRNGKGVVQSDQEAVKWYRQAANQGLANAQHNLGWMYANGQGVVQSDQEAFKWYQKAAEQGDVDAQFLLGVMYASGQGVEENAKEAFEWFKKAANQGNASAQNNLGWVYENGRGVVKDYAKAKEWYEKAADQGDAIAQSNLGEIYEYGRGVTRNYQEAVEWYQRSAEQGNNFGKANLARMYYHGTGIEKNVTRAHESFLEAVDEIKAEADQEQSGAQYLLGWKYQHLDQNYQEAVEWYQKAADQSEPVAQYNLGQMYEYGWGVTKDARQAVAWYQKAADQGLADAQYVLEANLTDFHFNANIDDVFSRQGKVDYIGKDTFIVDKDTVGSTITRSFSKEIQKSFSWGLGQSLGGSIKANYSVGIPLLGGAKGEISGQAQLTATQTWTTSKKYTIQVMDILNPKREGVYEMSALVYMLDNVTIPFTAYAKLTAVSKNTQARTFTTPVVKRLYQINGCTYDLGCPVQQDDTSLTVKIKGEMTGTYDVKSFTSVRRLGDLGDNSITERKESQNQIL